MKTTRILITSALVAVSLLFNFPRASAGILNLPEPTVAQASATRLMAEIVQFKGMGLRLISDCVKDSSSQATLDAFGTNSAAVLSEYAALITYATTRLTVNGDTNGLAALATVTAKAPSITINSDGTATINAPSPTPTPTP